MEVEEALVAAATGSAAEGPEYESELTDEQLEALLAAQLGQGSSKGHNGKPSKSQKRKQKQKEKAAAAQTMPAESAPAEAQEGKAAGAAGNKTLSIKVDYVKPDIVEELQSLAALAASKEKQSQQQQSVTAPAADGMTEEEAGATAVTTAPVPGTGDEAVFSEFLDVFKRFQEYEATTSAFTQPSLREDAGEGEGRKSKKRQRQGEDGSNGESGSEDGDLHSQGGSDHEEEEEGEGEADHSTAQTAGFSRKQRKLLQQLAVAELKRTVAARHPEVVEAHDATARDPKLLIYIKSSRNSVPVPRHWCHKRRYLQGKKGIEKAPFQLPDFITATGITKMRNAEQEAQDEKTLKARLRERYVPKMGRIEIAYDVLHDAFFKFQTKPKLSSFGELYYEGKEFEQDHGAGKRPGVLSDKLRAALGMLTQEQEREAKKAAAAALAAGQAPPASATILPPPWLINQQRYGPPPSYPSMRIPGLNAPLPPGAAYGMHGGGWGKPPVDEYGRPLYGDVFGHLAGQGAGEEGEGTGSGTAGAGFTSGTGAVKEHWGEMKDFSKTAVALAGSLAGGAGIAKTGGAAAGAAGGEAAVDGLATPIAPAAERGGAAAGGTETPMDGTLSTTSTLRSLEAAAGGAATPDMAQMELRKGARSKGGLGNGLETPEPAGAAAAAAAAGPAPELYRVLEQKQTGLQGTLLGVTHGYVIPPAGSAGGSGGVAGGAAGGASAALAASSAAPGGVALALAPEELQAMDAGAIARKFQEAEAAAAAAAAEGGGVAGGVLPTRLSKAEVEELRDEQERKKRRKDTSAAGSKKAKDFKF